MKQETLLKIIELLRNNLDNGLTILKISQTLKIGYDPAHKHIIEMYKQNIITINKVGNAKQCFLNIKNDKCRNLLQDADLIKIDNIYKNIKIKNSLGGLITKLTEKYIAEMQSIILFGSYAKNTQKKNSDIDILFIVNDLKNKQLREDIERECSSIEYSYSLKISPIITDIIEFKKMLIAKELNVGKEIREYGISLYGSEKFWRILA